jgi:hypothetical protein
LLDSSKEFDEKVRYGVDPALLDCFSYAITSLDRFDSVLTESHQKLIFHLGELRHAEIEPDQVPFSEHAAPY